MSSTTPKAAPISTEDMIAHYQRSIEKSQTDPKRLLHCIDKLYRMKVTVQHLQATGIGRTINALRKDEGEVGVAAKSLVAKWKAMVAAEESSDCSEDDSDQDDDNEDGDDDDDDEEEEIEGGHQSINNRSDHSNGADYVSSSSNHKAIDNDDRRNHVRSSNTKNSEIEHHNSNGSRSNKSGGSKHHTTNNKDGNRREKSSHSDHQPASLSSSSSSRSHGSHSAVPTSSRDRVVPDSCDRDYAEKLHNSILEMAADEGAGDDNHDDLIIDVKKQRMVQNNHNGGTLSSSKHHHSSKSSHHERPERSSSNHKSTERDHHHSHSSSKSSASSNRISSRHGESSSSRSKSNHRHEHKSSSKEKSRDSGSGKRRIDSSEEESHNAKRQKGDKPSTSSSSSTNSPKKKSSKSSSGKSVQHDSIEIDQSMGTSFAEALGMLAPSTSKSSKTLKPQAMTSTASQPTPSTSSGAASLASPSSTRLKPTPNLSSKSTETFTSMPALLAPKAKLPPLEDLSVHLPSTTITNNYKPLPMNPLIMDCVYPQESKQPQRIMTDEEMFHSIATKNIRTKVYSGVKSGMIMPVPTLHELCIRVLQKNIDALEYTGGVPFEILRPVMDRATPDQLFTLEHYNAYLMDDSDVLWQQHCARKFRGYKRREMETWREMYSRCTAEQDKKLSILTENIKHSQTVAIPVKQTKLAYVDSMVKPPRNVMKKQAQFGTERKLVATPAARVSSLSGVSSNIAKVGDARLRALATVRDTAQQAAANPAALRGPKKAPLMAKTLQLMKGRFKR